MQDELLNLLGIKADKADNPVNPPLSEPEKADLPARTPLQKMIALRVEEAKAYRDKTCPLLVKIEDPKEFKEIESYTRARLDFFSK